MVLVEGARDSWAVSGFDGRGDHRRICIWKDIAESSFREVTDWNCDLWFCDDWMVLLATEMIVFGSGLLG